MNSKLPKVVIEKPEVAFTSNSIVHNIVHFIDKRDVQRYLQYKFVGELYTHKLEYRIKAEEQTLSNELKCAGYEIIDYDEVYTKAYTKAKQEFDRQLKKETAKLRHEISILQKKLNKLQEL